MQRTLYLRVPQLQVLRLIKVKILSHIKPRIWCSPHRLVLLSSGWLTLILLSGQALVPLMEIELLQLLGALKVLGYDSWVWVVAAAHYWALGMEIWTILLSHTYFQLLLDFILFIIIIIRAQITIFFIKVNLLDFLLEINLFKLFLIV